MAPTKSTAEDFRLARAARRRYGLADLTLAPDLSTARTIAARVNSARQAIQDATSDPTVASDPATEAVAGTGAAAATTAEPTTDAAAPVARTPAAAPAGATSTAAAARSAQAVPTTPVTAGELHAAGLLIAILGRIVDRHRTEADPAAIAAADIWLRERLGQAPVDSAVAAFAAEFPASLAVPEAPDRGVALTQLLLLGTLDENPAVDPFRDLVDLTAVREGRLLETIPPELEAFFATRPGFGPGGVSLVELLRQPAAAAPGSLGDQLRWIRDNWVSLFGDVLGDLLDRLLVALDVLAEEKMAADRAWFAFHDPGAGGPAEVYDFTGDLTEEERFSQDRDWMPRLVLIAKSTYVWLDQLSRRYGRDIHTLDAIPDEELDAFARWGITGLWLIGLWERSKASERIKRLRGDESAVASAYSLDDYAIAADLGGPAALDDLSRRATSRGIRVASDMVPNHMGIDSRWVVEQPDRFLSLPDSPFPSYTFNGADLSSDERVGIFLEDHYYDSTDASVVFKRVDRWTGDVRYVYHGNDGTSFPWNDTAQLDYSRAEVREAVIQTILQVARQFPVIRFDAAMVLVKKHIQRLWFPEPGHGGAIPSRAGYGMTRAAFDRMMPKEFWREVVDRVAEEVPGTLLLAEAFWLLEGYFVRTLGMHRVYNSAFMNMLRDEQNAEYRQVMKNTLEFDPAILGRFVNFMSNPDERTAVDQFGTGDRYFGVAAMMSTLPGLPMYGHGQIEGFAEKYGMEFRRARLDEQVDLGLFEHHHRTIFPILHRRAIFAGSAQFRLFDLVTGDGSVDENVFAYSNVGPNGERSLVLFNNRYGDTSGRLRDSVTFMDRMDDGGRELRRVPLSQALGLSGASEQFLFARDQMTDLEFLFSSAEIAGDGLPVELGPYGSRVFVDLAELKDGRRPVARLHAELGRRGIPSVEEALLAIELGPVHAAVRARLAAAFEEAITDAPAGPRADAPRKEAAKAASAGAPAKEAATATPADALAEGAAAPPVVLPTIPAASSGSAASPGPAAGEAEERDVRLIAAAVRALDGEPFDARRLRPIVMDALAAAGLDAGHADEGASIVRALVLVPALRGLDDAAAAAWFREPASREALHVHEAGGTTWFDKAAFARLVAVVAALSPREPTAAAAAAVDAAVPEVARPAPSVSLEARAIELARLAESSGYRVDQLVEAITG